MLNRTDTLSILTTQADGFTAGWDAATPAALVRLRPRPIRGQFPLRGPASDGVEKQGPRWMTQADSMPEKRHDP